MRRDRNACAPGHGPWARMPGAGAPVTATPTDGMERRLAAEEGVLGVLTRVEGNGPLGNDPSDAGSGSELERKMLAPRPPPTTALRATELVGEDTGTWPTDEQLRQYLRCRQVWGHPSGTLRPRGGEIIDRRSGKNRRTRSREIDVRIWFRDYMPVEQRPQWRELMSAMPMDPQGTYGHKSTGTGRLVARSR